MNFLNPSILFGLFAISIPIIIHLLNLRKIRKIEFSTLMFLKEIQKSKMRRIKLKQLLLLLLRIMAIVFLVMCFARPVYQGISGSSDSDGSAAVLIFIDDSFSMSARDNKGLYFNQAKDAVKNILNSHSESDDIYMIPFSRTSFKNYNTFFDSNKELLDSLEKLKVSYKPFDLQAVLNYADQLISNSKKSVNEVFIISDFQRSNTDTDSLSKGSLNSLNQNSVRTYLLKTGDRIVSNLSIDSFEVASKIIEKDKDVKVRVNLTNHSQFDALNKTVNLYVDNQLRGERVVDVNSFDSKVIEFIFKPVNTGSVSGMLELVQSEFQDDEIVQDNKYFFSLFIPVKFNIGMISGSERDSYFLKLALQSAASILSDSIRRQSDLFNIRDLSSSVNESIFDNDVVFISNKRSFTDNEAELLKDYVANGGGLFLFPGSSADISNYNTSLLSKLNTVRIGKLNEDKESNLKLKFDYIDFENPVLSEIFLNPDLSSTSDYYNIESPDINSYFELLPNETANTIIRLDNGKPFLVESKFSKGRVIISSVPATEDFSSLPFKSIFVPMLIRSIYYLSNNFEIQKEYIVGNSNLISVRSISNISDMILPDKTVVGSGVKFDSQFEKFLFLPYSENTTDVGVYTLQDSSGRKYEFAINKNSAESNMNYFEKDEILEYFRNKGIDNVRLIEQNETISESIEESRTGLSLWKYFLAAAVLFALAEIFFSKKIEEGV